MNTEDGLLRKAIERVGEYAAVGPQYGPVGRLMAAYGHDGTFADADQAFVADLRVVLSRLSASHQPAAPAWGVSRERIAQAFFRRTYGENVSFDNEHWAEEREFCLRCADDVLALPPPAPGLDPEAALPGTNITYADQPRVIDDLSRLVRRLCHAISRQKDAPDRLHNMATTAMGYLQRKGLQGSPFREDARTIIAMAPPADASQSAEVVRLAALREGMEGLARELEAEAADWAVKRDQARDAGNLSDRNYFGAKRWAAADAAARIRAVLEGK